MMMNSFVAKAQPLQARCQRQRGTGLFRPLRVLCLSPALHHQGTRLSR